MNNDNQEEFIDDINLYYNKLINHNLKINHYEEYFLEVNPMFYDNDPSRFQTIEDDVVPNVNIDSKMELNGLTEDDELFTADGWARIGDINFARTRIAKVNMERKFYTFGFAKSVEIGERKEVLVRSYGSLITSANKILAIKTLKTPKFLENSYDVRVPPTDSFEKVGQAGKSFTVTAFHLPTTVYYGAVQTRRDKINAILNKYGFHSDSFIYILQLLAFWLTSGSIDKPKERVAITTSDAYEFLYILHLFDKLGLRYQYKFVCECYASNKNLKYFYIEKCSFKTFIWDLFSNKYGLAGQGKVDKYTQDLDFLFQLTQYEIANFLEGLSIDGEESNWINVSSNGLKNLYMRLLCLAGHGTYYRTGDRCFKVTFFDCKNLKSYSSTDPYKISTTTAYTQKTKVFSIDIGKSYLIVRGKFQGKKSGISTLVPGENNNLSDGGAST
ncbi:uncharacterized protein KGF55_003388 [Candida pseudojiufengensis]|uniref:uncharacterized protein n=1 Tax=Candida pseudojiufengensis TaxID=497109 RepID=UPI002224006E|nr:uncharacterized protein KGF55_003388 [Candida pseudojiufengensis]KAI5962312.1 hypothetical protein KGF55_003388 [Candida pseudojiufengensis]